MVHRENLRYELDADALPSQAAAQVALDAFRGAHTWESARARLSLQAAQARVARLEHALEEADAHVRSLSETASAARFQVDLGGQIALDARDKRVYWVRGGWLWRMHYGAAVNATAERLRPCGAVRGLLLHGAASRLYWLEPLAEAQAQAEA